MQKQSYLKNIAKAVFEPVVKSLYDGFPGYGAGFSMIAGRSFSWDLGSNYAYNNKIYYSAINILIGKLIEAPIIFSRRKSSGKKFDKFYSKAISNEKRYAIKKLSLDELDDHELITLFDKPNSYQSGMEMMEDFWHNYASGDGFLLFETLGEGSRNKKPIAIHSLNRNRILCVRSTNDFDVILEYRYTTWNGRQITIDKEHILHLKHWNNNLSDLKGLGIDMVASMDIALNNANNEMQGSAFRNGGRGTLFSSDVTVDSANEVVEKMTAPQMEVLKDSVQRDFSGVQNYRKEHFTNGLVNVQSYGDTLVETEAVNAENSQWRNIYTIVGVPHVLSPASSSQSENSVIVGFKSLVTNTVLPIDRKFDQKLNQKIQQWWPDIVASHDVTEYSELAPDLKLMKEVYGSPLLRTDETRAIFGYDELGGDEGKAILVASGLMQLSDLIGGDFETDPTAEEL